MMNKYWNWIAVVTVALAMSACAEDAQPTDNAGVSDNTQPVDDNGKQTFSATGDTEIIPSKDDSVTGRRGLPVSVDSEATSVWPVKNAWADTTTAAAKKAGMAWGENSGLNWDEKYQLWIDQMEKLEVDGGYWKSDTYTLTTPWGKTLPAPALECAESAIFLRITFASWYNLPFFMEAADRDGRIYFGHFGMRRADGKFGRMPNFRTSYRDYSDRADSVINGGDWPSDASLKAKAIPGSFDDEQPMLGPDAHAGAYFDEIFLNKRVGHFTILTLAWFGSVNLSDPVNTFNIKPEAVESGDVLIERWQKVGIGHALIVMSSDNVGTAMINGEETPQLEVELASGSMPRRQPQWDSAGASKSYFTMDATGGPDSVEFGGGIKRWRAAKNVNGRWTNVILPEYTGDWINSTDHEAISARTSRFDDILVELSPEQKRTMLLDKIESKRQHLRRYPASCSARINREDAFDDLYELMGEEFEKTAAQVDVEYRTIEDYVFQELEYSKSKTCCWNQSTGAMYEIAMEYNVKRQEDNASCLMPAVFMNRDDSGDGYQLFRDYAESIGRGAEWVAWSEDEGCPQRGVAEDTIAESDVTEYCSLPGGGAVVPVTPTPTTGDVVTASFSGTSIPDNSEEGVTVSTEVSESGEIASAVLVVDITHTWSGDLSIELVHPDGTLTQLKTPNGASDSDVHEQYDVSAFVGKSAAGTYKLIISDVAAEDTGELVSARLELDIR